MANQQLLLHLISQGLQGKLAKVLGIDKPQIRLTNNVFDQPLAEGGGYRTDNPKVKYPITSIRPALVEEYNESYRPDFMAKSRFALRYGTSGEPGAAVAAFRLIPVKYTFEFGYITDDPTAFLDFTSRWIFHSKSRRCNFKVNYSGVRMDIRVELTPSFDVPEKESSPEQQAQGSATSQIIVYGYATDGDIEMVDRRTLRPTPVFGSLSLKPQKT